MDLPAEDLLLFLQVFCAPSAAERLVAGARIPTAVTEPSGPSRRA